MPVSDLQSFLYKYNRIIITAVLSCLAVITAFLVANNMLAVVAMMIGGLCGLLLVQQCLVHPIRGYYILLIISFFAAYPNRILDKEIPIATAIDLLVLILLLGTLWSAKRDHNQKGSLLNYSVAILLLINVLYFVVEVFNPNMQNMGGWLFVSKRYAVYVLMFIITYRLINTPARVRYFFKFWILMAFISAAYACYQEWFGYLPIELRNLQSNPHEFALMFQGGQLRKISFFGTGPTFGNFCGLMAAMCLIIAINTKEKKYKYKLGFVTLILFLGMSYAGIRTTNIILPLSVALYVLMELKNKTALMVSFATIVAVLFLLFAPLDHPVINRMRSTFDSKDESLNLRNMNRKLIQPYLYAHPMGGGIATAGLAGLRFNPNHELAGFPPDSALVSVVLETGWIGLALMMLLYLMILYQGIHYYFVISNEEYRLYILGVTCALFAVIIAQFSTSSIDQIPTVFFFYGVISIFKRLYEFDSKEKAALQVA